MASPVPPPLSDMTKSRRRLVLACDTCRSRRVKCGGQRPCCAPCRIRGLDCCYQKLPESPANPVETELANVNMRLDYLTALLSKQPNSLPSSALSSHEDSPFRLLATQSIMHVLGLEDNYTQSLIRLERANLLVGTTTSPRIFFSSHSQVTDALAAFSGQIHGYYPILPLGFTEEYFHILSEPLTPSSHTCLALLVAAIGGVVRDQSLGSSYYEAALASLPIVLAECTLTSIQCLIFFSIYYCCLLKPFQAHDYCLIASFKIQNLFKSGLEVTDSDALELTHRTYWAILLLESELGVQFDVSKSDIWNLGEYMPLPNCHRTWQFPPPQPSTSLAGVSPASAHSSDSTSTTADQAQSFFLAEIGMRRLLHRCNSAVTYSTDNRPSYAPGIALELERQVDEWYDYLPVNIRFPKETSQLCTTYSLSNFLNVQYYCCKLSIYWPAVYQAIQDGRVSVHLQDHCQRFIDSYVELLPQIVIAIDICPIYKWTLSISFFVTTLAALKVLDTPCLNGASLDELRQCISSAAFKNWKSTESSASLRILQNTLNRRLQDASYQCAAVDPSTGTS
ncbi:hypothetical protein N7465_001225 [Penicillium sp. CMV-2018d]|nr:hypothetical protein N7465_001225 [Penicillium sp. CMV-2018d]